jgi:transposase
MKGGSAHDGW